MQENDNQPGKGIDFIKDGLSFSSWRKKLAAALLHIKLLEINLFTKFSKEHFLNPKGLREDAYLEVYPLVAKIQYVYRPKVGCF